VKFDFREVREIRERGCERECGVDLILILEGLEK